MSKQAQGGFTILEAVVVAVCIIILVAIAYFVITA